MRGERRGGAKRSAHAGGSRGFTLTEVVIALTLLTVGLLGLASFFVANARAYDNVSERILAVHAMRETAETLRAAPFGSAAATYKGYTFTIADINATGTVTIFTDETDSSTDAKVLGLPRDLDGDGAATNKNVSASYLLLPVKVGVTWTNTNGAQSQSLFFMLAQETN